MSTGFPDWTRAYLLIGSHEGELIPVYVDADGHLYAALQGEYEGELRTIALDDQGRISAFVIDSSDAWGQMLAVGNAELAVRLGAPIVYSQSGRVVFMETWKNGIQRVMLSKDGAGGKVELSPAYCESDGYSLKMVTGSTDYCYARCVFYLGQLPNTVIGFALSFMPETEYNWLEISVTIFDSEYKHLAKVILNHNQGKLQIVDGSGVAHDIASVWTGPLEETLFRYLKFTIDLTTHYYKSLFFDNVKYDISSFTYSCETNGATPRCWIGIKLTGREGYNDVGYIDNCIFTTNET